MALDILGLRSEDERRRAIVAQRNALARQADPNAEQTPFRSGLSRAGAFLQNIPSALIGTPRAETEFSPFSGQQGDGEELRPLAEAALGASSSEDFAAIMQRPDLFPDPAGPEGPITRDPKLDILERTEGGGFRVTPGLEARPPILGFEDRLGAEGVSERARQGFEQTPGTQRRVPDATGAFSATSPVLPGPERLTPVPAGVDILATRTEAGSPGRIAAKGREVPVKPSLGTDLGTALGQQLNKSTEAKIETTLQGNAARRERLQGILRSVTDNPDRLRILPRVADMFARGLDSLVNPTPEEAASIKAFSRIRRRVNEELVLLVKEISGAQVSDKEREFIKSITTSLPSGPTELIAVLEDVIMMNDFSTARLTMWDEGGRQGRPWLIQNDQVQTRLQEEILRTGSVMVQKGVDAVTAADLATTFVEQRFGISPGGFDVMSAEFDRGAPNFGQ